MFSWYILLLIGTLLKSTVVAFLLIQSTITTFRPTIAVSKTTSMKLYDTLQVTSKTF